METVLTFTKDFLCLLMFLAMGMSLVALLFAVSVMVMGE